VSAHDILQGSSAELVRRELATADRRRRVRVASRAFWRAAPFVALGCACLAAVGRWQGWPAALPLGVFAATALVLLGRALYARREHSISDAVAAGIDETAGLAGELRSASWFASRDAHDAWADCHLDRAARRLESTDWANLYPSARTWRPIAATAVLALCTVALSVPLPGRSTREPAAVAALPGPAAPRAQGTAEVLLPELQKELEALLAAAESGGTVAPAGAPATAAELRSLIAGLKALRDAGKLKDLARAMTPPPEAGRPDDPAKDMKALADRARKAAEMPAVAPEARDTLEEVSDDMADAARAMQPPGEQATQTASSEAAKKSDAAPGKKGGDVDEASIQSVSEAESGGGAGIIMMGNKDEAAGKAAPGLGMGGGSDKRTEGGRMADLEAALRRETIEASADNAGDNVQTEARRKTEHGQATVTYAHSAAGTFDRSRAVAPPPVPERRRAAVQTYFIRKQ
jgi:hypothetical protein